MVQSQAIAPAGIAAWSLQHMPAAALRRVVAFAIFDTLFVLGLQRGRDLDFQQAAELAQNEDIVRDWSTT